MRSRLGAGLARSVRGELLRGTVDRWGAGVTPSAQPSAVAPQQLSGVDWPQQTARSV